MTSKGKTQTAFAYIKGIDSQPRKVSIVAALVRDRYVADAIVILEHTPRRAALTVKQAIESAKANLLNSHSIDVRTIAICRISVSAGSRIRRYKPASRGRALPFEKIRSNLFVEVMGEEKSRKKTTDATSEEHTQSMTVDAPKKRRRPVTTGAAPSVSDEVASKSSTKKGKK
jgi:large subunit ribosomal protein L22